jgi:hypothetical protein
MFANALLLALALFTALLPDFWITQANAGVRWNSHRPGERGGETSARLHRPQFAP